LIDAVRRALSQSTPVPAPVDGSGTSEDERQRLAKLTPREREVLHLLAQGKTNRQVAAHLGITTKTAETHRARIISKLELHSVSDLVRYAIRHGIIQP
jgi:DNA-binding NarL/FixJ family response regulator